MAQSEKKILFLVIKNPKSETVTFSNRPSGVFFVNNKKNIFSDKVEINYTNGKEQTLEFVWDNEDFSRGDFM